MNWVLWVERTLSWEWVWLEVVWEEFKDLESRYNQNTCKILKESIKNVSGGKKAMEREWEKREIKIDFSLFFSPCVELGEEFKQQMRNVPNLLSHRRAGSKVKV